MEEKKYEGNITHKDIAWGDNYYQKLAMEEVGKLKALLSKIETFEDLQTDANLYAIMLIAEHLKEDYLMQMHYQSLYRYFKEVKEEQENGDS